MKTKLILSTLLALGIAGAPFAAAQEPDQQEKPKPEEPKKQPPPPKPKPEKPNQEPAPPPKEQKPEEKPKPPSDKERQKQQKEQEKDKAKQERRSTERAEAPAQKSAHGKGQKIPPERFRSSFGREHTFHVSRRDDRRFQYGGYWFELVEVWPAGWSFDDDCYIEEDGDDYYLVDLLHPQVRILVIVVTG